MLDEPELRQHYETLPDERLRELATYEAVDLLPEAARVLKEELRKRGLADDFERRLDAFTRPLSNADLNVLVERFRHAPCPCCGSVERPLNGATVATTMSFIVIFIYEPKTVIACPKCIAKQASAANVASLLLGWWGLLGPIYTIRAVMKNIRAKRACSRMEPSEELVKIVEANRGDILLGVDAAR